jgi:predicted nucleic acid-binding Zn finger protein
MTQAQFDVRNERAENGTFVISRSDGGFRVYSVHNPSSIYLVLQEGDRWTCTCPDFESHKADTTWRCKHILAVAPWSGNFDNVTPGSDSEKIAEPPATPSNGNKPPRRPKAQQDHPLPPVPVQMIMKRSVSPDGRIDSISVEFSVPVSSYSNGEIKQRALSTLELQKEIVGAFLKLNGQKVSPVLTQTPQPQKPLNGDGKPVFARMVDIGKVNGKWGDRLCLNVAVNGRTLRLFGSAKQLAEKIQSAGYDIGSENLEPGLRLNLACRVTTKPSEDGKYLNVENILPLKGNTAQGGSNDGNIPY